MDDWLEMLVTGFVLDLVVVTPEFEFDRTSSLARFGNKVVDCTLIDDARLEVTDLVFRRDLSIVFGIKGSIRLNLPLTKGATVIVADDVRERVLRMLEVSSIVIPRDKYDPTGKFARSGSPSNLTKEEAIELVRNPPMPGDRLPVVL